MLCNEAYYNGQGQAEHNRWSSVDTSLIYFTASSFSSCHVSICVMSQMILSPIEFLPFSHPPMTPGDPQSGPPHGQQVPPCY